MKKKMVKKGMAILATLIFLCSSVISIQGGRPIEDISDKAGTIEWYHMDYGMVKKHQEVLSEEELQELTFQLSDIIDTIQYSNEAGDFDIANTLYKKRYHPLLSIIVTLLQKLRMFRNRALIISCGWGYQYNPAKDNQFKIRSLLSWWHYTSKSPFNLSSKTLIMRHSLIHKQMTIIKGMQIGLMTQFR